MELCDGGDAHDFLTQVEDRVNAWEAAHDEKPEGAPLAHSHAHPRPKPHSTPALMGVEGEADPGLALITPWTLQMAVSLLMCKHKLGMVSAFACVAPEGWGRSAATRSS